MRKRKSPDAIEIETWLRRQRLLDAHGKRVLGAAGWRLFEQYGRVTVGPKSGLYVSALSSDEVTQLLEALARGEVLPIHLMHRHVSGHYESSRLLLVEGKLVMRFAERDEAALRSDRIALAQHLSDRDRQPLSAGGRQPETDMSLYRPRKRSFESQFERDFARFQHPVWKLLAAFFASTIPRSQGFGRFGERSPRPLEESISDFAESETHDSDEP